MGTDLFTRQDAWGGGFYELSLELPEASDKKDILEALIKLWSFPGLEGCYLERDEELTSQNRTFLTQHSKPDLYLGQLLGVVDLPNGAKTNCLSTVLHEFPIDNRGVTNWIELNVPLGGLGYSYPVGGFPFDNHHHLEWRVEIDKMLKEISEYVYMEIKFTSGLIGFETDASDLELVYDEIQLGKIPEERYFGRIWPNDSGLLHFPANC